MALTRRYFLGLCGSVAVTTGLGSLAPASLFGQDREAVTRGKTLVVLFQRGGADGLNIVVPFAEENYPKLRPGLAMKAPAQGDENAVLDLDGQFGLHPRMASLMPFWNRGELSILHAVGNPKNNRSHFVQQDQWETCQFESISSADGWLNRHLQTSQGHGTLRAVSIGNSLPRMLRGKAGAQAIRNVQDLAYNNRFGNNDDIARQLRERYGVGEPAAGDDVVEHAGRDTLDGLKALEGIAKQDYTPAEGAAYPENNGLAAQLRTVAHLIKSNVGLEIAVVNFGGWDTHNNQGNGAGGNFGNRVGAMADAMAAFARDLGDRMSDVLVLTMTEFGRTARQNGTAGTDHGHASVMFALGGAVADSHSGKQVLGRWPGLDNDQLNQKRDLQHTTDFRNVLTEVVTEHLGNHALGKVIPDHTPTPVGLLIPGEDF